MVDWKKLAKSGLNKSLDMAKQSAEKTFDFSKEKFSEASEKRNLEKKEKKERLQLIKNFNADKKISDTLHIDTKQRLFKVQGFLNSPNIHSVDDIMTYELIEDGDSISSGGLGRAAIGGLAFGGAGAVVGAITGGKKNKKLIKILQIKITMNNIDNPVLYIDLISTPIKKGSILYKNAIKTADNIISTLNIIVQSNEIEKERKCDDLSLRELKSLLDDGIINQEEFNVKKKKILDI